MIEDAISYLRRATTTTTASASWAPVFPAHYIQLCTNYAAMYATDGHTYALKSYTKSSQLSSTDLVQAGA